MTIKKLDIDKIPLDDKKSYELLSRGLTHGIFQLESDGMKSLCKRLKPTELRHLDAIIALWRPSSIQFIDPYIKYKENPELTEYFDERAIPYLKDTYGQMIYQEQMMQIAQSVAGYSMAEADSLRRSCGKKNMKEMLSHKETFISRCIENKIGGEGTREEYNKRAETLFNQIVEFANYSFNRSHSLSYAIIAYQTAYLKSNYPLEFMTALLNKSFKEEYMDECYALNIDILPPDINFSEYNFKHDKENYCIRFGFGGLKGIGESAVKNLILERKNGKFTSFIDIIERMPSISKSTLEVLIKSGALNTIEKNPYKYLAILDYLSKAKTKGEYKKGEATLFDTAIRIMALENIEDSELNTVKSNLETLKRKVYPKLTDIEDKEIKAIIKQEKLDDKDKIEYLKTRVSALESEYITSFKLKEVILTSEEIKENEKELLGFSLTYNCKKVLVQLQELIHVEKLCDIKEDKDYWNECLVMLEIKSIKKTKTGSYMAVFMDETSEITSFLSREFYNKYESVLEKGNLFYVNGKLKQSKNPAFGDGFEIINMRQFLINSVDDEIYLIGDISEENLKTLLTNILSDVTINNVDIKYRLSVENNGSLIETNINLWIDDIKRISNYILKYNLRIGKRQ